VSPDSISIVMENGSLKSTVCAAESLPSAARSHCPESRALTLGSVLGSREISAAASVSLFSPSKAGGVGVAATVSAKVAAPSRPERAITPVISGDPRRGRPAW